MTSATHTAQSGRFIIYADLRSKPSSPFEAAIHKLGSVYRLSTTVWLVRGTTSVGTVRNMLAPHMGSRDGLMIVEIGTGRSAWQNYGPEVDAHLHAILDLPKEDAA